MDNRIVISVYNTGLGIPAAELTNVFKQFYRVEKSRSLQYGGSGLGLAMVRKIVRMHGGSVHMDSVEGKWAKITVELPVVDGLST
jgi:signal transduction histidine kinase